MDVVLQTERHECGLASIAMLIRHNGGRTTLQALRQRHKLNVRGTNALQIVHIAQKEGIELEGYELELGDLACLHEGTILHYRTGHYVVYGGQQGSKHVILDPEHGQQILDEHTLESNLSGIILSVTAVHRDKLPNDAPMGVVALAKILEIDWRSYRGPIAKVALLTVAVQASLLIAPQYLQAMIDIGLPGKDRGYIAYTASVFVILAGISAWCSVLRGRTIASVGLRLARKATSRLLKQIGESSLEWHERQNSSSIHARQQSVIPLQQIATQGAIDSLIDIVLVFAMIVMMMTYSTTLAAITLVTTAIVVVLRHFSHPKLMKLQEREVEYEAREQAIALENLDGIRSLHVYKGLTKRHQNQMSLLTMRYNVGLLQQKMQQDLRQAATALYSIDTIVIVAISISYIISGTMTLGALLAFMMYKAIFSQKSEALIERLSEVRLASLHVDRLADILTSDPLTNTSSQPVTKGHVKIQDMSFSYHAEELVIDKVSLEIKPGEFVAITGPTGGGKSTLAKLIAGIAVPTSGSIMIDGHPAALGRDGLVFMMQDDLLYTGTIRENVDLSGDGDDASISDALRKACIMEEIEAMPLGLNTLVGTSGVEISGGQKQRILIARALHANPVLLIMDEATSALDEATQERINAHLKDMGVTRIAIAHRRDTIQMADKIFRMESGNMLNPRLTGLVS